MPQVVIPNGELCGSPGPAGSPGVYCFFDFGDPNLIADPMKLLANCALGSSFQRVDPPDATHAFYIKTSGPTAANVNGLWTNK